MGGSVRPIARNPKTLQVPFVAVLGVSQGWLPVDWLLVVAIAVSVSRVHPNDRMIDTGDARVLIIGMGRVGTSAYDELSKAAAEYR